MKVELFFKSHDLGRSPHIAITIEGEPRKVRELVSAIEEKARQWEGWEEE